VISNLILVGTHGDAGRQDWRRKRAEGFQVSKQPGLTGGRSLSSEKGGEERNKNSKEAGQKVSKYEGEKHPTQKLM